MPRARKKSKKTDNGKAYVAVLIIAIVTIVAAYAIMAKTPVKNTENMSVSATIPAIAESPSVDPNNQSCGSSTCGTENAGNPKVNASGQQVIAVEEVIPKPGDFIDSPINLKGTVVASYPSKQMFTMGCSCRKIPVRFSGKLPDAGSQVIAYGMVKKNETGYVFEAESIK